ncbi:MAG: GIY-YIG nuclease family protein [Bacteroidota bacterium]|nr:GIY-YIG nuclease family protein [Bacteroidota bacterium]MDP3146363.1 GIY-YIG nuclease family protein [Bacteroidota bacterium]MDP3556345.1 GIY-YIG nuclease family protein [Bacteroidota bacterium]
MKTLGTHNYFIYFVTNITKKVLYCGVTNDLKVRLHQHEQDSLNEKKHFAGKYNCFYLIYFERFQQIEQAIKREHELKGWSRKKKDGLIKTLNPNWNFLNNEI